MTVSVGGMRKDFMQGGLAGADSRPGCPIPSSLPDVVAWLYGLASLGWRHSPQAAPPWRFRLRRVACLGVVFAITAAAQTTLTVPLDGSGNVVPPAGMTLESIGVIHTLAGTGRQGFGGDGGSALFASFRFPRSVAVDGAGNVYVADSRDHRIRKIDGDGTITTYAGTGDRGYSGDEGPATEARLAFPMAVAADAAGNVYVADGENHRIRKINGDGTITTYAGTGQRGYAGDGGSATEAQLAYPAGVAVDAAGNVFVADSWNHRVRRIDSAGTITTYAGSGTLGYWGDGAAAARSGLAYPSGVAADAAGNVYVADNWNHRIRRVDPSGAITTIAGRGDDGDGGDGGQAAEASLAYPVAVGADLAGNIYAISYSFETNNHRVRRISASGVISAYAGTGEEGYEGDRGPAAEARLAYPTGVAADANGNVYVADARNALVRVVRPGVGFSVPLGTSGESVVLVVSSQGVLTLRGQPLMAGARVESSRGNAYSLAAGTDGAVSAEYLPERQRVLVRGTGVDLTRQEDGSWRIGDTLAENGHRHSVGGREYVLELQEGRWGLAEYAIETVAGNTSVADGVAATRVTLENVSGVAVDAIGNVYVTERTRRRIRRIDLSGVITTFAGTGDWGFSGDGGPAVEARLGLPSGVAVDRTGRVYVADDGNIRVRRIDVTGVMTTIAGTGELGFSGDGGPAIEADLVGVQDVATDTRGNVYLATWRRIRKIDPNGVITTIAGTGQDGDPGDGGPAAEAGLSGNLDVAADAEGNVYIADASNHRVRKVGPDGTITTLAGTGERGYSGDGGSSTDALVNDPRGVAVDASGSLYVADRQNNRIRRIDATGVITTFAGTGEMGFSGDGGPAVEARIGRPSGVAVDQYGSVYIANEWNSRTRIRKVDSDGTIATVAGSDGYFWSHDGGMALRTPLYSPAGVALNASDDLVFIDRDRAWRLDASGAVTPFAGTGYCCYDGREGSATAHPLPWLTGIAADASGNVYLAASWDNRILRVDSSGVVSNLAGTGNEGYSGDGGPAARAAISGPCAIASDPMGNVYFSESNYRIRKIDTAGMISTVAGTGDWGDAGDGGPASRAQLSDPCRGIAADTAGNIYVRDGNRIRRIDISGVIDAHAEADWNSGLAVDRSGRLYYGSDHSIRRINADRTESQIAGTGEQEFSGDGGPARSAGLSVSGMAVDRFGNVWFADRESRRIRVLRHQGN